jgi:DNA-binding MarR family transcriptional regulator
MSEPENTVLSELYLGCLYFNIMTLSRDVDKYAQEAFKPLGISSALAMLLIFIISNPSVNPKKISGFFHLAPSTTTRLLDKLEKKGLIKRKYIKRNTYLNATKKAENLDAKLKDCWNNLYQNIISWMGEERYQRFLHILQEQN